MVYDISKIGSSYYLYAVLPNNEKNYTLLLKNIYYFEEGREKREDVEFNFSVKGNVSGLSINPGFIITSKDFSIKATSNSKEIVVKSTFEKETKETTITAGAEKNILFQVKDIEKSGIFKVILESEDTKYDVPVYFLEDDIEIKNNQSIIAVNSSNVLVFYPSSDILNMKANSEINKKIYLLNNGTQDIKDLKVIISSELKELVSVNYGEIEIIESENYTILNLIVNSKKDSVSGKINVLNDYYFAEFPLTIQITGNETLINQSSTELKSCSALGGKICKEEEVCASGLVTSLDNPDKNTCCLGGCEKLKDDESSSNSWIITLIVIVLLLGIIYFVYKKLKVKGKSPEKVLRERAEDYEDKFKSREIRGNLKKY
jgi:hypothetical protein